MEPCANIFCPRNDNSESGCKDHSLHAADVLCSSFFGYNESLADTMRRLAEENERLKRANRNLIRRIRDL